jgi:hypothetical protein
MPDVCQLLAPRLFDTRNPIHSFILHTPLPGAFPGTLCVLADAAGRLLGAPDQDEAHLILCQQVLDVWAIASCLAYSTHCQLDSSRSRSSSSRDVRHREWGQLPHMPRTLPPIAGLLHYWLRLPTSWRTPSPDGGHLLTLTRQLQLLLEGVAASTWSWFPVSSTTSQQQQQQQQQKQKQQQQKQKQKDSAGRKGTMENGAGCMSGADLEQVGQP